MIKAIVIDDEAHVRQDIRDLITTHFKDSIDIQAEACDVPEGLNVINQVQPDLLFLDVHLGEKTGFDLIAESVYKDFEVIFVTGFDQHAIKAIKVGALDYILKPIDPSEFKEAVQKAIIKNTKSDYLKKFAEVSQEYFRGAEKKRIILKTMDNVYAIYEDDIVYCNSEGNYTTFYTQQTEKIVVSKSMKKIEELLSEDTFVRCHQSYIVNKKHVLRYNKRGYLIVNFDTSIPVSGRRKDYALKKIFDN